MSDVGKGMQLGSTATGYKDGGVLFVTGWVLEKVGGSSPETKSEEDIRTDIAQIKSSWKKKTITWSPGFTVYAKNQDAAKVEEALGKARDLAERGDTGLSDNVMLESAMLKMYKDGKWVFRGCLKDGDEAVVVRCHKNSDICIVSMRGENLALPAVTEVGKAIKKALNGKTVKVGEFSSFDHNFRSVDCGNSRITSTSFGESTFAKVFENNFRKEFRYVGAESQKSDIELTGNLKSFEFSISDKTGGIVFELVSSNGKKLTVSEKYVIKPIEGETLRITAKAAIRAAVKNVVDKAITSPEFAGLVETQSKTN